MRQPLGALFYRLGSGKEPVREWLRELEKPDRIAIGKDIRTVQLGWPIGMPTCGFLREEIHEVRTNLAGNRTARVLFFIEKGVMHLLHSFIKKDQKTPDEDIRLAIKRKKEIQKQLASPPQTARTQRGH